ncbi:hypothetical protein BV22DRAFT_92475 [Leucogyrophana mollusca]|uniref:Uncharacterized protein n=1 Tax=Leucogyrophana mollusca TaxID=85980 RepID=A0ACB8BVI7_9AGAM|nr:hypothetical protein BV22DRAFT_92475 [Leucogyrophana mollusca]
MASPHTRFSRHTLLSSENTRSSTADPSSKKRMIKARAENDSAPEYQATAKRSAVAFTSRSATVGETLLSSSSLKFPPASSHQQAAAAEAAKLGPTALRVDTAPTVKSQPSTTRTSSLTQPTTPPTFDVSASSDAWRRLDSECPTGSICIDLLGLIQPCVNIPLLPIPLPTCELGDILCCLPPARSSSAPSETSSRAAPTIHVNTTSPSPAPRTTQKSSPSSSSFFLPSSSSAPRGSSTSSTATISRSVVTSTGPSSPFLTYSKTLSSATTFSASGTYPRRPHTPTRDSSTSLVSSTTLSTTRTPSSSPSLTASSTMFIHSSLTHINPPSSSTHSNSLFSPSVPVSSPTSIDSMSPSNSSRTLEISIGAAVGGVALLAIIAYFLLRCRRHVPTITPFEYNTLPDPPPTPSDLPAKIGWSPPNVSMRNSVISSFIISSATLGVSEEEIADDESAIARRQRERELEKLYPCHKTDRGRERDSSCNGEV